MAASRSVSELGFKSTYQQFIEQEGIPVIKGFLVQDIRKVASAPWEHMGGLGAYLNLEGSEGVDDAYICEIPAGKSLNPQRHLFDELVFVVSGHGATTVWRDDGKKQTFKWQEGALFSPLLNVWHRHFNGQGNEPVRLLSMTNAPTVLNLFHNVDFAFNCGYEFANRYDGGADYFSGKGKALSNSVWDTNFVLDVRSFELKDQGARGARGTGILFEIATNVMSAHISQFPANQQKMKLPNGDRANLGTKLEEYALNPRHREGRHKARMFDSVLGITRKNQQILRDAILAAARDSDQAEELGDNGHGEVYVLRLPLKTEKAQATILTAWIIRHGEDFPTADNLLYTLSHEGQGKHA